MKTISKSIFSNLISVKVDNSAASRVVRRHHGEEHPVSEVNHVRQVCIDLHPKTPAKFSECVLSLSSLEVASDVVEPICQVAPFPRYTAYA